MIIVQDDQVDQMVTTGWGTAWSRAGVRGHLGGCVVMVVRDTNTGHFVNIIWITHERLSATGWG